MGRDQSLAKGDGLLRQASGGRISHPTSPSDASHGFPGIAHPTATEPADSQLLSSAEQFGGALVCLYFFSKQPICGGPVRPMVGRVLTFG
jgi:hypothetical protein